MSNMNVLFFNILPKFTILGGQKFTSDTEMQSAVRQWLGQKPASFFTEGIRKIVYRWDQCLNEYGRYAEK